MARNGRFSDLIAVAASDTCLTVLSHERQLQQLASLTSTYASKHLFFARIGSRPTQEHAICPTPSVAPAELVTAERDGYDTPTPTPSVSEARRKPTRLCPYVRPAHLLSGGGRKKLLDLPPKISIIALTIQMYQYRQTKGPPKAFPVSASLAPPSIQSSAKQQTMRYRQNTLPVDQLPPQQHRLPRRLEKLQSVDQKKSRTPIPAEWLTR